MSTSKKVETAVGGLAPAASHEEPVVKAAEKVERPPLGLLVSDETKARIVDLCRHAVRTDPGQTGKLATQILADLGVE